VRNGVEVLEDCSRDDLGAGNFTLYERLAGAGRFCSKKALRFAVAKTELAGWVKLCQNVSLDGVSVVCSANGNAQDRQRSNLEYSINLAIAHCPLWQPVRRIIKLDRDDWRKCGVANYEIDMFGTNTPEVRLPEPMIFLGFDQISQPDFRMH
jgi:hypothetical protein